MKKLTGEQKNAIILFCLIALTVAVTVTIVCVCANFFKNEKIEAGDFVSITVAAVSFAGSMVLGIIAFWQTKSANAISKTLSREKMISNIILLGEASFSLETVNSARVLEFAKDNETEGLFCSTENKQTLYNHSEDDYLCLDLCFITEQAAIDKIKIDEIFFNKSFNSDGVHENFSAKFNILNKDGDVVFSFNPAKNRYSLQLFINCDKTLLKNINDNEYFNLDILMEAKSNYKAKQSLQYSLNFVKINELDSLLDKKIKKIELNLERVIVHKGEIEYE